MASPLDFGEPVDTAPAQAPLPPLPRLRPVVPTARAAPATPAKRQSLMDFGEPVQAAKPASPPVVQTPPPAVAKAPATVTPPAQVNPPAPKPAQQPQQTAQTQQPQPVNPPAPVMPAPGIGAAAADALKAAKTPTSPFVAGSPAGFPQPPPPATETAPKSGKSVTLSVLPPGHGIDAQPFFDGVGAGAAYSGKQIGQTAQTVTGGTPKYEAPPAETTLPSDWTNADQVKRWLGFQIGQSAPAAVATTGAAYGLSYLFGPEVGLVTSAVGAGLALGGVAFAQTLGPIYAQNLAQGMSKQDAFNAAWATAEQQGGLGFLSGAAFGFAPFKSALANIFAQSAVVQPAITVGAKVAANVQAGKDPLDGVGADYVQTALGTLVPVAAFHGVTTLFAKEPPKPTSSPEEIAAFLADAQHMATGDTPDVRQEAIFRAEMKKEGWSDDKIDELLAKVAAGKTEAHPAPAAASPQGPPQAQPAGPPAAPPPPGDTGAPSPTAPAPEPPKGPQTPPAAAPERPVPVRTSLADYGEPVATGDGSRASPVALTHPSDLTVAEQAVERQPTPAQIAAGNAPKGHVTIPGLGSQFPVSIETAAGGVRSGVGEDGVPWSVTLPAAYGYVRGTKAADGEQLDVFLGSDVKSPNAFIVNQNDLAGRFDELKIVLGAQSEAAARDLYLRAFSNGHGEQILGSIHPISIPDLKTFLQTPGAAEKPYVPPKVTPPVESVTTPQVSPQNTAVPSPSGVTSRAPNVTQPTSTDILANPQTPFQQKVRGYVDAGLKIGDVNRALRAEGASNADVVQAQRWIVAHDEALTPKESAAAGTAAQSGGFTPSQLRELLNEEEEQLINMWHAVHEPLPANASDHYKMVLQGYARALERAGIYQAKTEDEARQILFDKRGERIKPTKPEEIEGTGKTIEGTAKRITKAEPKPTAASQSIANWHGEVEHLEPDRVKEALNDPAVKAKLDRPFTVDHAKDIKYLAGYSNDGGTIFIDKDIPTVLRVRRADGKLARMDPTPYLVWHERVEKALIDSRNYTYQGAHQIAVGAEHANLEADGFDPASYETALAKYRPQILAKPMASLPADLDVTPYKDTGKAIPGHMEMPEGPHGDSTGLPDHGEASGSQGPTGGSGAVRGGGANENVGTEAAVAKSALPAGKSRPTSLLREIISAGGIKDTGAASKGDLRSIGAYKRPGLINNKAGRSLDYMREHLAQLGYFDDLYGHDEASEQSTVADLVSLIDRELRGEKVYPPGQEALVAAEGQKAAAASAQAEAEHAIDGALMDGGLKDDPALREAALAIYAREGGDPVDAIERAAIALYNEEATPAERAQVDAIPGWEEVRADAGDVPEGGASRPEAGTPRSGEAVPRRGEVEATPAGQQTVLPGAERDQAGLARQRANAPLKPKAEQNLAPGGPVFTAEEDARQGDLLAAKPRGAIVASREPPTRIEDVGEKIGGARKDRWRERGLTLADLEGMTPTEEFDHVKKDNIWKPPDYQALIESGVEPQAAAAMKLMRDRLAARPKKDSAEERRRYIEMVTAIRDEVMSAKKVNDLSTLQDRVLRKIGWGEEDRRGYQTTENRQKLFSAFTGRRANFTLTNWENTKRISQMLADGWPKSTPRGAKGTDENGKPKLPERPHLDTIKRTGKEVRNGRDVKAEDFIKDFGFRGVEFGNWVASDERQKTVNLAFEALHDLADVLGVPPRALSFGDTLALAFGARGSGAARAHYEPGRMVINMTKLSGAGSLAHEWGHALDHYYGTLNLDTGSRGQPVGASGWYDRGDYSGKAKARIDRQTGARTHETRLPNLRPEMARSFDRVMQALFQKNRTKAEAVRRQEMEIEAAKARIRVQERRQEGATDPKFIKQSEGYIEQTRAMMAVAEKRLGELRGNPNDTDPSYGIEPTSFAREAQALSGKSVSGYWTRPTEMFARAFEAYVQDKIELTDGVSQYLVHGTEGGVSTRERGFKGDPYPSGDERKAIDAAFDNLVQTIETKAETTGAVRMAMAAAYHGSPYKFDEFSTDKIGTGEGAQAYGWGLYFAGSKGVAEYYRDKLAEKAPPSLLRRLFGLGNKGALYHVDVPDDHVLLDWDKPFAEQPAAVQTALQSIPGLIGDRILNPPKIYRIQQTVKRDGKAAFPPTFASIWIKGKPVYSFTSRSQAEAALARLEREDRQVGKGTKAARAALGNETYHYEITDNDPYQTVGSNIYDALAHQTIDQGATAATAARAASLALAKAGIPGLRYLDQGSRSAGEGTHNYVIFDDSAVQVRKREGIAAPAKGGLPATDRATIVNNIRAMGKRMLGTNLPKLEFHETIPDDGGPIANSIAPAMQASGREMADTLGGYTQSTPADPYATIVAIALGDPAYPEPETTAAHEYGHVIWNFLYSDEERGAMRADAERGAKSTLRRYVAAEFKTTADDPLVAKMPVEELHSYALQRFMREPDKSGGLHIFFRKLFAKVKGFFDAVRKMLTRRGVKSVDDIFGGVKAGKMADREPLSRPEEALTRPDTWANQKIREAMARPTPPPEEWGKESLRKLDDDLFTLRSNTQADRIEFRKEIQAVKRDIRSSRLKYEATPLFQHGEGDPTAKLTPSQQKFWDRFIAPDKVMEESLSTKAMRLARKTGLDDAEVADIVRSAGYMHRMPKGKTAELDALLGGDVSGGVTGGRSSRSLKQIAASMKQRVYYAAESPSGERVVISSTDKGIYRWDANRGSRIGEANPDLNIGSTVEIGGKTWTVKDAYSREIEANTKTEYYKDPIISTKMNIMELKRVIRNLQFLKKLKADPEFLNNFTSGNNQAPPEGWVRVDIPGLHGYVSPKIGHVINDNLNGMQRFMEGSGVGVSALDKIEAVNRLATASLFISPASHLWNVWSHWFVARGFSWANPVAYPRMVYTGLRAAKSVITHDQLYRDYLRSGASLIGSRITDHGYLDKALRDLGHDTGPSRTFWRTMGVPVRAIPAFVRGAYRASSLILWHGNDMLMMQQYLEREAPKLFGEKVAKAEGSDEFTRGTPRPEAISKTEALIPRYRDRHTIMGNRILARFLQDPGWFQFMKYRLDQFGAYMETLRKTILGKSAAGQGGFKERWEGLGEMAALGLLWAVVIPGLGALATGLYGALTGDDKTKVTVPARGPLTPLEGAAKVATGDENILQYFNTVFSHTMLNPVNVIWQTLEQIAGQEFATVAPNKQKSTTKELITPFPFSRKGDSLWTQDAARRLAVLGSNVPVVGIGQSAGTFGLGNEAAYQGLGLQVSPPKAAAPAPASAGPRITPATRAAPSRAPRAPAPPRPRITSSRPTSR